MAVFDIPSLITKEVNSTVNKGVGKVVNSFNTAVKTNINGFLKKGSEQILDAIGAPKIVREAVRNINAGIVQNAVASAASIFQGITGGLFTNDIVSKFSSLNAVKAGLKSKDKDAQDLMNLNALVGVARTITQKPAEIQVSPIVSPYAVDFADIFTPKFKFLFVVEFIFNAHFNDDPVLALNSFHTVIHKFTRPKIDIEHEDVNLYNFTTQVPKLIKYSPITFTAHDDIKGSTLSSLIRYVRIMSPIFRMDVSNGIPYEDPSVGGLGSEETMNNPANLNTLRQGLGIVSQESGDDTDSLKTIFKQINVYHVHDFGKLVDVYKFFNPKFTSITMDELDMSESTQGNSITFEMVYDGVFIDPQKLPTEVPSFKRINDGAFHDMVNRNVQEGINQRATQLAAQRKQIESNREFDQEFFKRSNIDYRVIDETNDAEVEQANRDAQYEKEMANINSLPSKSPSIITSGIKKIFGGLF